MGVLFVAIGIDDFLALHEYVVVDWRWVYFQFGIAFGLLTVAVVWVSLRHQLQRCPGPFVIMFLGLVMIGISGFLVEDPLLAACAMNRDGFLCENFRQLTRIEEIFELMGANVLLAGLLVYAERLYPSGGRWRVPLLATAGAAAFGGLMLGYLLVLPTVEVRLATDDAPIAYSAEPFQLRGVWVPDRAYTAGARVPVWLYWQADGQPDRAYHLSLHLLDSDGESVARTEEYLMGELPNQFWQNGMTIRKFAVLRLPAAIDGPVSYRLGVRVWRGDWEAGWQDTRGLVADAPGSAIAPDMPVVGRVSVLPSDARSRQVPDGYHVGGRLVLADARLPDAAAPGATVDLAFDWQATENLSASYSQFLHFFHTDSDTYFVADREPFGGRFPTAAWQPGYRVRDCFAYMLPTDAQPGTYQVFTGLYDSVTGARLPVTDGDGNPIADGAIPLAEITLAPDVEPDGEGCA